MIHDLITNEFKMKYFPIMGRSSDTKITSYYVVQIDKVKKMKSKWK